MGTHTHKIRLPLLALAFVLALAGCEGTLPWQQPHDESTPGQAGSASAEVDPHDLTALDWSEETAPNYFALAGKAHFDTLPKPGTVAYAPLDALGRAGKVQACITSRLMDEGTSRERGDTSDLSPSGWGNNRKVLIDLPDGGTYRGYFWNRSHLLAKSLGGTEVLENLVCGTRMQNVGANKSGAEGGMAYAEARVRNWLKDNPAGHVYYAAEPRYLGIEPVCRVVVVDVLSSDESLDFEVVVYNAAKGYLINYADGTFDHV